MPFPAVRDTANLNTLYTGAFESVSSGVQDIVFKETTLLNIAMKMGMYQPGNYSHHHMVPVIDKDDTTVVSFTGLQTLPTAATQGARSAYFNFANYATNVTVSWEEQQQIRSPHQIVDLMEARAYKAYRSLGSRLDRDMFWGNTSDSNNILGLEQAIYPKRHNTTGDVLKTARWQLRQANNNYGGVGRANFTADGIGGTGWENMAVDMNSNTGTISTGFGSDNTFALASGVPNKALRGLAHMFQMLTWGTTMPDLIISAPQPYEDYQNSAAGFLQYVRTGGDPQAAELGFSTTSFKGAQWVQTDRCVTSGAINTSEIASTSPYIFLLNTSVCGLKVSDSADFEATEFKQPIDQAGAVAQILWRGQLIVENPRYCGVMFNYGSSV
jgi:hypothetical protein